MVLRLVSGPMPEKSNRTGPLADRQRVLLTAKLIGFPFFSDFQLPGKREIFKKFLWDFGKFPEFRKSSGSLEEIPKIFGSNPANLRNSRNSKNSGKFLREIFSSLIILTFFLIFSISDLIFSILLCCFDKLSLSFSIFSTN